MPSHPDVERTATCADCGATVEWIPLSMGGWGAPQENPPIGSHGWTVHCRQTHDAEGRLVAADFHYVEGEVQRHYQPRSTP